MLFVCCWHSAGERLYIFNSAQKSSELRRYFWNRGSSLVYLLADCLNFNQYMLGNLFRIYSDLNSILKPAFNYDLPVENDKTSLKLMHISKVQIMCNLWECASSRINCWYVSQQGSCLLRQWCFWSTRHGKEHRRPAQQSFRSLSSGLHWEGKC